MCYNPTCEQLSHPSLLEKNILELLNEIKRSIIHFQKALGVPFWIPALLLALREYFFPPWAADNAHSQNKHKPLCTSNHKFRQTTCSIWKFLGFLAFFFFFFSSPILQGVLVAHHEMLEEPWAHDVGGVFGQDAPFVLGLLVLTIKEGGEIQVHLSGEKEWGENWLKMVVGNPKWEWDE